MNSMVRHFFWNGKWNKPHVETLCAVMWTKNNIHLANYICTEHKVFLNWELIAFHGVGKTGIIHTKHNIHSWNHNKKICEVFPFIAIQFVQISTKRKFKQNQKAKISLNMQTDWIGTSFGFLLDCILRTINFISHYSNEILEHNTVFDLTLNIFIIIGIKYSKWNLMDNISYCNKTQLNFQGGSNCSSCCYIYSFFSLSFFIIKQWQFHSFLSFLPYLICMTSYNK